MELKRIEIKSFRKLDNQVKVYDLSVAGNHNFFIGKAQTLTHNCDHLTPDAQAALRNMMEVFSAKTRFILTCNYIERITSPLISRCQSTVIVPPSKKDVAKRLAFILDQEKVSFDVKDVAFLVNAYYPDVRRIIGTAQQFSTTGTLKINPSGVISGDVKMQVLDVLSGNGTSQKKTTEIRKIVLDAGIRDFTELYRHLYEKVDEYSTDVPKTILALAEGQYRDAFVADKELCFIATIYNILTD